MFEYFYGYDNGSSTYLAHYGVKGMHWGVRRAIESGDFRKLAKQYKKAHEKSQKLMKKADIIDALQSRKDGKITIGASAIPAALGIAMPFVSKDMDTQTKLATATTAAIGLGGLGHGAYNLISGNRRSKVKGHEKAVKKVNDWEKAIKREFKGTKLESAANNRPKYNDTYTIYEHGALGSKDKTKPLIPFRAPTVSISGSSLARDSKNPLGKSIFKQRLSDSPQSKSFSDVPVRLGVRTPSGTEYTSGYVDSLLKLKKKRK